MLTSQVPPNRDSKRVLTSYPCSGSSARSPRIPNLSDMQQCPLFPMHTAYAYSACIDGRHCQGFPVAKRTIARLVTEAISLRDVRSDGTKHPADQEWSVRSRRNTGCRSTSSMPRRFDPAKPSSILNGSTHTKGPGAAFY